MRYGNPVSANNYWLTPLFYLIGELGASVANCLAAARGLSPLFRYRSREFPLFGWESARARRVDGFDGRQERRTAGLHRANRYPGRAASTDLPRVMTCE
jgi:hypothetical protein